MRRNRHDGAGAVGYENVVGDEDRDLPAVDGVDAHHAFYAHAGLFLVSGHLGTLKIGLLGGLGLILADRVDIFDESRVDPLVDVLMLRRNDHVCRAEEGVRTGGVDGNGISGSGAEVHLCAGRTAYPVLLRHLHAVNIVDKVKVVDQALSVRGDPEHPLALDLAHDLAAAALASAAHYLLVCKNALAGGAPVDRHLLFVGEPVLEELDEYPLSPLVIIGIGGIDLTAPVEGETERFDLLFKALNVVVRYLFRMYLVLYRVVFGRQSERVPAHREQHVVALKAALARDYVQRGIGARMSDVESLSGGIRELDKREIFGLGVIVARLERLFLIPYVLPFFFD